MKTAIDWSTKPAPWNVRGPAFKAEVEKICAHRTLREKRLAAGLTQAKLAERAGCAESTIQRLEYDTTSVSREFWARIDAALSQDGPEMTSEEAGGLGVGLSGRVAR
jgi:DNA-binding XRE family transcriptional regulator